MDFSSTITVLLQGLIWYQITREVWYDIKQRNQTNHPKGNIDQGPCKSVNNEERSDPKFRWVLRVSSLISQKNKFGYCYGTITYPFMDFSKFYINRYIYSISLSWNIGYSTDIRLSSKPSSRQHFSVYLVTSVYL